MWKGINGTFRGENTDGWYEACPVFYMKQCMKHIFLFIFSLKLGRTFFKIDIYSCPSFRKCRDLDKMDEGM